MPFLVFEGLDGSGKSTLIKGVEARLKAEGKTVLVTREPGGTGLGDELREVLLRTTHEAPHPRTELLLYEAARAEHVEKRILPALKSGAWVLCDRFEASSVAFQSGGRAISKEQVQALNSFATGGLKADLTILIDLPVSESVRRMGDRAQKTGVEKDRFEQEQSGFHEKVRASFLSQCEEDKDTWFKISGMETPESCLQLLLTELQQRFGVKAQ